MKEEAAVKAAKAAAVTTRAEEAAAALAATEAQRAWEQQKLAFVDPRAAASLLEVAGGAEERGDATHRDAEEEEPGWCGNESVAYLFITGGGLPLADVWRAYFDGCPAGTHTVVVHSQRPEELEAGAGALLPEMAVVEDPLQGNPRSIDATDQAGKWLLVDIQARLFDRAQRATTTAGCRPRWGKILSDSCAPAFSCSAFHQSLQPHAGKTLTGGKEAVPVEEGGPMDGHTPPEWDAAAMGGRFLKDSTWLTMWLEHYTIISAQTEQEPLATLRQRLVWPVELDPPDPRQGVHYKAPPHGTLSVNSIPEEGWWGNALRRLGLPYEFPASTYVLWTLDSIVDRNTHQNLAERVKSADELRERDRGKQVNQLV